MPEDDEVVVFKDFFVAGLHFSVDSILPDLLLLFNTKLHHLTPNAIVQLLKFVWAVRSFRGPVLVDDFCRLYELHPQGRKVYIAGEVEPYEAQSGCCTFVPRRNNKKTGLERIELSHAQRNRWDSD